MSNQTAGIEDDTERYIWAVYHIIVFLSSIIGDSLILYASFQQDAFKLNKFILSIIRHIAACDLIYAVSSVLPSAVSLLANSWVLGRVLCVARFYLGYFSYITGIYLIACLTISKLLLLKYPIRCSSWTEKMGHVTCCVISVAPLPFLIFCAVMDWDDIEFEYKTYTCDSMHYSRDWFKQEAGLFFVSLNMYVPMCAILLATIPTLVYLVAAKKSAQRARGNIPWRGALAVVLTAIICCLSTFPTIIFEKLTAMDKKKFGNIKIARAAQFLLIVNIMSNFYIYTLTIRSFRRFLQSRLTTFISTLTTLMSKFRRANADVAPASVIGLASGG